MTATVIDHIFTLQRSPYALAPIIHEFYNRSSPRERDILLSYLILPLVLFPPMRDFLASARSTSNLRTMTQAKERLIGLPERISDFKAITHASLLVLTSEKRVELSEDMSIKSIDEVQISNTKAKLLDAARGLAAVCQGEDIVTIYRMLGLKYL